MKVNLKGFLIWAIVLISLYLVIYLVYPSVLESDKAYAQGTNGKQLIYIPRHHANVFLNTQWNTWNLSYTIEMTGRRSTSYNAQEFFAYDLPSYVLHHIALGKQIKKFRLELRCNNLTDKDYQNVIWRAMPGRSFEVMVNYKY